MTLHTKDLTTVLICILYAYRYPCIINSAYLKTLSYREYIN